MAKSARIRSRIVYISNMFPQNESKQRDFGCHGKKAFMLLLFSQIKTTRAENIELRKFKLKL